VRVLLVAAHPVETSFAAALHGCAVSALQAAGHTVDDCDLYEERFDPVLTRAERLGYHDLAADRSGIAPYVARLRDAEALLFVHPVWNFGMPAVLKGFLDRVFVPGVGFDIRSDGRLVPRLDHLRRYGAVCTYGASRWVAFLTGDPPRRFMTRAMRGYVGRRAPCTYLPCYDMNRTTPETRAAFLRRLDTHLKRW
jgi:NAD(P)H dehydrogenase (quinone)